MSVKKGIFFSGIGIGIIVSSLFAFFIMMGTQSKKVPPLNPTWEKEEIIAKAQELGMIFITELPSATEDWTEEEIIVKARELGMDFIEDHPQDNQVEEDSMEIENNMITVHIPSGSSAIAISKILTEKGIIKDPESFYTFLLEENATKKLRSGQFQIPLGSTYEEILWILQRKEKNT
ncbi:MAG: endolytic transglycosylase MltG [Epulopiscium sp.]|nr:endolytic transglycosylase MltG [Candidatus Epulonipiscium sp.]